MIISNALIDMTKAVIIQPIIILEKDDQILGSDIIGGEIQAKECLISYERCVMDIPKPILYSKSKENKPSAYIKDCKIIKTKLPPFDCNPLLCVDIEAGEITFYDEQSSSGEL